MKKPSAPRVMNGKFGMLYWDGEPVYEVDSFEAKLKLDREDVDFVGEMGKDSKLMGYTGEFSFKIKKIFSRGQKKIALAIRDGKDPRAQFIGKVDDPDAYGSERVVLDNCWFSDVTLMNFEVGKFLSDEFSGGFTEFSFPDLVEVQ